MSTTEDRKVDLPPQYAGYVDRLVADGLYGSASDVVAAGLLALQERDAAVDAWLRDAVAPVYDAMENAPERRRPAQAAFDDVRARHAERLQARLVKNRG
ncbi:MAG: type II toxin-antitoxin system ParD family antitoxin [Rhodospirillales bacterium]|nr:type II toxin-antitoxin system ParD family antitoxin [Rhodospirillales bacterium]